MKKLLSTAVFSLASLALMAGCSESVDREGSIDQLVESGLTQEQAECMVNGLVDEIGDSRAIEITNDPEAATSEEDAFMAQLGLDCLG